MRSFSRTAGSSRSGPSPKDLLEVKGRDPLHLTVLAWHLGNRHLAAQIEPDRIVIRHDPVIAHMLEHQGAQVRQVHEPFDPEEWRLFRHMQPWALIDWRCCGLMTWLSPAFPVGAFSYSHGLEYAVHDDTVTSRHDAGRMDRGSDRAGQPVERCGAAGRGLARHGGGGLAPLAPGGGVGGSDGGKCRTAS